MADQSQDATAADDLRVFAPRRTRQVAFALAAGWTLLMVVLAAVVPDAGWGDRVGFLVLALVVDWFLWRQASVRAVPSERGLHVRNLLLSRDLEWAQVVSVRFGERPWVQLDLDDGDTLAVMGIQRSDGERARAEAVRLARLVESRSAAT
jgi:hypothetical protein